MTKGEALAVELLRQAAGMEPGDRIADLPERLGFPPETSVEALIQLTLRLHEASLVL